MKVAFFNTKSYDRKSFDPVNESYKHELRYLEPTLTWETRSLADGCDAVCIFVNDKADEKIIEYLSEKGIRLMALRCAGFNNVDLAAAHKHQITVVRVPAYSPHAVAEHAVALILTLNRKIHKAYNRVREQNFSLARLQGFDLYGKTVGVIGTGKIGSVFANIMKGFGCEVIAYDKFPSDSLKNEGISYVDLITLWEHSDIISLHCPLTPETHHIVSKEALAHMKNGVMLINTSRGGLIDTKAVIEGLKSRKLGYVGIDVYEQEDELFFKDLSETVIEDDTIARLMSFPNVLVTAHQAFFTNNALYQIAETTLKNISTIKDGKISPNEVTLAAIK